jgi:hypothetical protein
MAASTPAERRAKRRQQVYAREIKRLEHDSARGRPWFLRDQGARLQHDRAVLARNGFSELVHEVRGREVVLTGFIPIVTGPSGITHRIATEVRFPDAYPRDEPAAYDAALRFQALPGKTLADRHLDSSGSCCLWLASRSEWKPSDPDALAHFLSQLTVFFERQLVCDVIKRWPGPEYAHGDAAYVQDVQETLGDPRLVACYERLLQGTAKPRRREACPCKSGDNYVVCHKPVFDQLSRRIPHRVLDGIRHGAIALIQPLAPNNDPNPGESLILES